MGRASVHDPFSLSELPVDLSLVNLVDNLGFERGSTTPVPVIDGLTGTILTAGVDISVVTMSHISFRDLGTTLGLLNFRIMLLFQKALLHLVATSIAIATDFIRVRIGWTWSLRASSMVAISSS
ncbi:hypothetical protein AeNC1_019233 [Aphanomyces euteiches]|nr:hypothetical protein AeNC1_019233 [Aphanomyces euteiches]